MTKTFINFLLLALVLIPVQAVVFNNLILFGCAIALVFIYLIITLPITVSTNAMMTIGFIIGLCVDIFSDTLGLNAVACTITAFVKRPIYHLYMSRDEDTSNQRPGIKSMGIAAFLKYSFTMTLIYCTIVFMLDAFTFFDITRTLLRIAGSTVFTLIFIYAFDALSLSRHEKKL